MGAGNTVAPFLGCCKGFQHEQLKHTLKLLQALEFDWPRKQQPPFMVTLSAAERRTISTVGDQLHV